MILKEYISKTDKNTLRNKNNPEISWRFRNFFLPLPSLNNTERYRSGGGERRPSDDSGHFLCSYFRDLPEVSSGHRRLHPGRTIRPWTKSILFGDRDCSLFLFVPVLGGECSGREAERDRVPHPQGCTSWKRGSSPLYGETIVPSRGKKFFLTGAQKR